MSVEHIGRLQAIGAAKEATPGTPEVATFWLPKASGQFTPVIEQAKDESAYGTIDGLREGQTVKQMTEIPVEGFFRHGYGGHLLMAALGTDTVTIKMLVTSVNTGTLTVGDAVTGDTSAATGTVKRVEGTDSILVEVLTGTFVDENLTMASSTATVTTDAALRTHFFERLNNNCHPSYTFYGQDPVGTYRAPYSMMDNLTLEMAAGEFVKFNTLFKGKKQVATTATPVYASGEESFISKHVNLYIAANLAGLNAATASEVTSVSLTIEKNLIDILVNGSGDVNSLHNQKFMVRGELTAIFNSTVLQDFVLDSTKKAMRIKAVNTDATIGAAGNPELIIDLARVNFESWSKDGGNDDIVTQTLGFEMEFSTDDAEGIVAFLQNTQTTTY